MKKRNLIIKVNERNEKVVLAEEEPKALSMEEESKGLLRVKNLYFNNLVEGEREYVISKLLGKFRCLRYEDLEEVYNDGCLVLWEKMMDKEFKLKGKSVVGYLLKICWNIAMHYLRKIRDGVVSLDKMMEKGFGGADEENGLEEMFEVLAKKESDEEKFRKLEEIWKGLKEVDRMILESYYLDGCKMEEIARRVGYKNGNSVKSKKNRVLKKMMEMMKAALEPMQVGQNLYEGTVLKNKLIAA